MSLDIAHEFSPQILFRREDAASNDVSLDFGKPNLNLVQPRRIGRRVVELDLRMRDTSSSPSSNLRLFSLERRHDDER